jgi:hypothetical protein
LRKLPSLVPIRLRRNRSSSPSGSRRLAAWSAALAAFTLLAGVLQTASASSVFQTELVNTQTQVESSSPNNLSLVGEKVTYKATVTSDTGTPTAGNVDFLEKVSNDAFQPISTECTDVDLNPSGEATCEQTYNDIGTHIIKAQYSDESLVYRDSESAELTQTVKYSSTVTLSWDETNPPTVSGESVLYTASVAPSDASVTVVPTGTITFRADGNNIDNCIALNLADGTPTCTTNFPVGDGDYVIEAVYSGDSSFVANTSNTITQAVGKANSRTDLSSDPTDWKKDQPVTFTAAVVVDDLNSNGVPEPTGTVTFRIGTTVLCGGPVDLVGQSADCSHTFPSTGSHEVTAEYSGDPNYATSADALSQVVTILYQLRACLNPGSNCPSSSSDPTNATFTISGAPRLANYRLCVSYFGFNNVEGDWPAVTPPPVAAHSGIHRFGINFGNKCKKEAWSSGASSDTDQLLDSQLGNDDFGFATKGTYEVSWFMCENEACTSNGQLIGTDMFTWNSWCPPNVDGFRQIGVWRTSRHKVRDSCYSGSGNAGGRDSHFDKDRSVSWNGWHNEFVARDYLSSYGAPSRGAIGLKDAGWGSGWRQYVGVRVCDTYHHGKSELHPMFMAQKSNGVRYVGGPQYSTSTPSISGTWKTYKCS